MNFNLNSTYYKHIKCNNKMLKQNPILSILDNKLRIIKFNNIKIGTTFKNISSVNKKYGDKDNHNHC